MELRCPHCSKSVEFSSVAPRFCSNCGKQLSTIADIEDLSNTLPFEKPVSTQAAEAPERLGGYQLGQELGRGGMGIVYEAEQENTGRRVALKLLPQHLHRTDETVRRFLREGELAASLSHPRSTFIYSAGESDGQFYIAMELMPGGTLKDVVDREGALPIRRAVDYVLDISEGLEAAHASGVIHRDVKPSNCFVDHHGRAKVGDYGLSKSLVTDAALTRTGAFMGTPQFAAPEQIKGEQIDERTDVYAVGATLYYLIAGEAPFQGDAARVIAGIAAETPPRLRDRVPEVPKQLDRIIAETLQKDPAKRPASLSFLRAALMPYSSRGSSIADVGRRLAAYFIDTVAVGIAIPCVLVVGSLLYLVMAISAASMLSTAGVQFKLALVSAALLVAYFAIAEGRYGCGLGKWMMGLRVVDDVGEPAGVGRGLLRAAFIPGLMVLCTQILPLVIGLPFVKDLSAVTRSNWVTLILAQQAFPLAGWFMMLLCLVTMRRHNGFRGVHEFASGTRVVRAATIGRRHSAPVPVTLPVAFEAPDHPTVGEFQIEGIMGTSTSGTVYLARDGSLGRPVWVLQASADAKTPFTAERISTSRPTRPFWLQCGESNGHRWDAIESIRGAPLAEVISQPGKVPWEEARGYLTDLLQELIASLNDNTLPRNLSLDHVWLDSARRLKLLDVPIARSESDVTGAFGGRDVEQAWQLVRTVLNICRDRQMLPAHALDLVHDAEVRPASLESLEWAAGQLQQTSERPTTLGWDDRMGVLAVSMGTELMVYTTLAFVAMSVVLIPVKSDWIALAICLVPMLGLPALLGFFFGGGPVFRLTGLQVRDPSGAEASRARCAWRSFIAWHPSIVTHCCLAVLAATVVESHGNVNLNLNNVAETLRFVGLGLVVVAGMLLQAAGGIYAIVRPARGFQDLIAGTRLVPE